MLTTGVSETATATATENHDLCETWQLVWRTGIAPQLDLAALAALRDGLARDDATLVQGRSVVPPGMECVADWPIEAGDCITYALWQSHRVATVGDATDQWAAIMARCDAIIEEKAGCRWLLNWYDDTPREVMRRELLAEVVRAVQERFQRGQALADEVAASKATASKATASKEASHVDA